MDMLSRISLWFNRYERHLSAAAMVAGFAIDSFVFKQATLATTQVVFLIYASICAFSILALEHIEARAENGYSRPRFRPVFPIATQFALGGFWSGFLILYGRSAVMSASWPFLALLVLVFIGNELFRKYHDRLVFTSTLFFFALYSYAIFSVPIYVGALGTKEFLESGVLAILVFFLFTSAVRVIGKKRFRADVGRIWKGALVVLVSMNIFYFTNILPPLPLTLTSGGVYHAVSRTGDTYAALAEKQSWKTVLGFPSVLHTVPGESVYAYSAIFAPVKLATTIVHRWERYDPALKKWKTEAAISFPITGGRNGGYRGYSAKANLVAGEWRVDVETVDGRLVGRLRFTVVPVDLPPLEVSETLL